jgi:hypothetical protein
MELLELIGLYELRKFTGQEKSYWVALIYFAEAGRHLRQD